MVNNGKFHEKVQKKLFFLVLFVIIEICITEICIRISYLNLIHDEVNFNFGHLGFKSIHRYCKVKCNFGKNGCTPRACKWWISVIYLLCTCSAHQSHLPDVPTTYSDLCSYLAKRFLIGIKPK